MSPMAPTQQTTSGERREKILRLAAGPRGCSADLYQREAAQLRREGRIKLGFIYTATGRQKPMMFLVAP